MAMDLIAIKSYINQLPDSESFTSLESTVQDKVIFGAYEKLKRNFGEEVLTNEMSALQVLFYLEGKEQDFAAYRRQGIKSVTTRDVSFTFDTSLGAISPEVIGMIDAILGADGEDGPPLFGRLT